jgi:DNA polymerase-3 subunit delta
VEAVGADLRELASAADVLCSATEGTIDAATVRRMFAGLESQVWTFVDSVMARDRVAALRHLHALLGHGENPIGLLAAVARQLRTVALVKGDRRPSAQLAKEIGVKEGAIKRALRQARGLDDGALRRAFRALADADLDLKGGDEGTAGPPELVLELVIAKICGIEPARR